MKVRNLLRVLVLALAGAFTCFALADVDHDDDDDDQGPRQKRRHVAAPIDPAYKAECGSCHMLYPSGLLPARSWTVMMGELKNHFGENASLDPATNQKLTAFLTANAADRVEQRRSQKIARSIPAQESPQRFTETHYFKRQHDEVSAAIWKRKSIGSPANCVACHGRAEAGIFSDDEIRIPK
jgi:mono/diheme cytochrome c family protein